jgi:oxalate decarboxylase/phosphoglucose isomerase-like protein (cupin superfamily)
MKDYTKQHYAQRSQEKMREVLMDPGAQGPAVHYHMVRGGTEARNITVWEQGTVGGEYIKTYGHYHVGALDETYWVIFGEGVVLVQKRVVDADGKPIDDEIRKAYAVHVKTGDAIFIPAEWGHLVANIGQTFFVTADDSPVNFEEVDPVTLPGHADYEAVKRMQGFCYYIVEKDGKPELVRNQKYSKVPEIEIIEAGDYPLKKE